MTSIEIFFSDLKPSKQKELMESVGITDPAEMNWDIDMCPLTILEFEDMSE